MSVNTTAPLTSLGKELELSPEAFGELRRSDDVAGDGAALQARMSEDGYLFLPGLLDVEGIRAARQHVVGRLAEGGLLDEQFPHDATVTKPGTTGLRAPEKLVMQNAALREVLYAGPMMALYERLLGGAVRHYDFTWFRCVRGGGSGTYPHCDIVYMGRGTFNLYTSWTPIGDIPVGLGGLMILEGSHRQGAKLRHYLERDVDEYCTNHPDGDDIAAGRKQWQDWDGRLSSDPVKLREKLGGRWLTTDFQMGDVLVFGMATVHASLDNQTNRFRLSSDSRYQLASEPVDDRWVGEKPVGHGPAGKRGKIC
jgi:hypothetical protein